MPSFRLTPRLIARRAIEPPHFHFRRRHAIDSFLITEPSLPLSLLSSFSPLFMQLLCYFRLSPTACAAFRPPCASYIFITPQAIFAIIS